MSDDENDAAVPRVVELGIGMLPDPWRNKLFRMVTRFAGKRVAPEVVRAFTEEGDAARGRAILSDAIAVAGAEVLSARIRANPELAALAISRSIDDQIDRQENLNQILRLASAEAAQDISDGDEPPEEEISEDWRRKFTGFAEEVSDEQMQSVWARMLAGEFRQPGTFSYRTLRLVSELSPEVASLFESIAEQIIEGNALITIEKEWNEGPKFELARVLADSGILQDSPGSIAKILIKQPRGQYFIPNKELMGVINFPGGPKRLTVGMAMLSEPGKQLYKLLPPKDERIVLRRILNHLVSENPRAEIARIAYAKNGHVIETVFQKDP